MEQSFDLVGIMNTLTALVMEYGLRALGGLALFLLGKWVAGRIRAGLHFQLERSSLDPTLIPFAAGMVYWALMAFVILAVLNLIGVQTASAIAVLGAAGLAVGLALQGTLSNFAAGVMLLLFRPFHVGEWVEVASTSGTVKEIGMFSTALNSGDNIRVTIPNSQVYGQTIRNFSTNETRRIDLVMGVSYDDDLQVAREVMERVLSAHEKVLADPAPLVAVDELADSSVNFVVRPWCRREDYWAVRRELTLQMKLELEAAGCSIPYPQRDVHLHQVEGGPAAEG
ncbi:MAG: mechanosensitive ion channel family protein [Gemmatimonadales bacterium]|nr:MAG: mechanosensitive ion channel family protein [Gemmatimonadales bacterium]